MLGTHNNVCHNVNSCLFIFSQKTMSRYLLPEDRGCFCCEPQLPSGGGDSQEMQDQQLQGPDVAAVSRLPTEASSAFVMQAPATAVDRLGLTLGLHGGTLSGQQISQADSHLAWNCLPGNNPFEVGRCHASNMFTSTNNVAVTDGFQGDGISWNFRALQGRQLGGKMSRMPVGETSSIGGNYGLATSEVVCDKLVLNAPIKNTADNMDIDSALDELGMLSTVTNSRREYLMETRGQASYSKQERRLHSKSKSSPNLTALSHPNGYRIVQMNTDFVTGLTDAIPLASQASSFACNNSLLRSESGQLEYRASNILQEPSRRRSGLQMSRLHKDRYRYRRSRCPYKIPNRLCTSLQESDFGPNYFNTGTSSFEASISSSSTSSLDPLVDTLSNQLASCPQTSESKSNSSSPVKPLVDVRLTRSLSAEDLATTCRCLKQELADRCRETSSTDRNLDVMTCQMTNLHMS